MAKNIEKIEGIGPKLGEALRNAGIRTADDLLEAGADKQARVTLAEKPALAKFEFSSA